MYKSFYRCIAAIAVSFCFLAGCGGSIEAGQKTGGANADAGVSGDPASLFDQASSAMEVGSFSYGWPDERDVFTYSGQPLEIPFRLMGTMAGTPQEIGLLLFVDGIAQPYCAVFADGSELTEAYMQTFRLEQGVDNIFDLVFQPVTGKAGDNLSIQAVAILAPSYLPQGAENPNYGFYHSANITIPLRIAFEKDAPAEKKKEAANSCEIVDIPKSIADSDEIFGLENSRDTNSYLSVIPTDDENSSVIYAKDGTATFKVRLYGGPEADHNITVFVNHQPVQIDKADYLAVRTQKDKMLEATITLDVSVFGEIGTIYAIASSAGRDSGLTETVKSPSVLFINK